MASRTMAPGYDAELSELAYSETGGLITEHDVATKQKRSRRLLFAGASALALAGAAAVFATRHGAPTSIRADDPQLGATSLEEEDSCTAQGGNCISSKCCKVGGKNGYQCFKKNDNWAQCMENCEPGVHPGEKEGTYDKYGKFVPAKWSCQKLGNRSAPDPCSAPGDDCSKSKCCSAAFGGAGMTCFEKDDTWASCAETCDKDDWTCNKLGPRTPFPAGCGWAGKSCADTNLCCNLGFVCAVKDEAWTACVQTEKKTTWMTTRIPIPANWEGTILGGGRKEYSVPPAKEGEDVMGTTLYCFMAFLPDSYEVGLHTIAKDSKASIFACDSYDVFHSWQSTKSGWDTGEATLTNTDVFINVWKNVIKSAKFMYQDWTVKVDADALLLPDRLRPHLAALRPPAYRPLYIKNNAMDPGLGNNGFLGAVEVFSRQAVQIYSDNADGCHTSLGIQAGEDGYFKGCMDALGVGFMTDPQLFNPDKSPGICNNKQRAAFHPLKSPKNWKCCLDITQGINHNVIFGDCQMPDPLAPEPVEKQKFQ